MDARMSEAGKRYAGRFASGMVSYVVLLIAVLWWMNAAAPQGWLRYVVAVVPTLPILGVLAAMGIYLKEEPDEFGRAVLVQAMLWGLGFILAFTTVWGFLEELAGAPHFPLYGVFPIFCGGMGISQLIVRLRYR